MPNFKLDGAEEIPLTLNNLTVFPEEGVEPVESYVRISKGAMERGQQDIMISTGSVKGIHIVDTTVSCCMKGFLERGNEDRLDDWPEAMKEDGILDEILCWSIGMMTEQGDNDSGVRNKVDWDTGWKWDSQQFNFKLIQVYTVLYL